MSTEVKQRKKTPKTSDQVAETSDASHKDEAKKASTQTGNCAEKKPALDPKTIMCLLSLATCGALSWIVLQQNENFSEVEAKYKFLHDKTASLFNMEQELLKVSKKCESIQTMLEALWGQRGSLETQLKDLEQDVTRLKEWVPGMSDKGAQLQTSLATLQDTVGQIEGRTSTITKGFGNKVASVRTDVRRMDGLRSELESLLTHLGELEEKTTQVERSMVKRIGDVLAGSIDRVSNVRATSERNAQAIDQLRRRIPELVAADAQLSERLREIENSRARVIRTVSFAGDLKPKVAAIKRDFGEFEPQLSDLTLRIGRLAEDLTTREQEIAELRQTLSNLTAVEGELGITTKQVSEIADLSDIDATRQPT
ncbi:inhibitor of nuclear factor kappa-B kinase-interacting protein isoform X2 [Thalassophryne amazonica]|uniref:inhibitor of nuclear factor kappa-B kinase-interacting protein isoform X2 n=1 Tax=Thalassophryne amazonica TaxID=390379 RepID=UPI0014708ED4|nr:inhibitor of nuclear factor kappa-B kinase-interacting protein isoform X2 [Thalassophryne amazonica]